MNAQGLPHPRVACPSPHLSVLSLPHTEGKEQGRGEKAVVSRGPIMHQGRGPGQIHALLGWGCLPLFELVVDPGSVPEVGVQGASLG